MPPTTPPRRLPSPPPLALLAATLLTALLSGLLAAPPALAAEPAPEAAAEPATAPVTAPAEEPAAGAAARAAARRDAEPSERMWWNREKLVAGLGLSPEQRAAMDERFDARLEERRAHLQSYGALRGAMIAALTAGDWDEAEARRTEAATALAAANGAENGLVIDVFALLSPTQRRRFGEENPQLLHRPWLIGGMSRALRRGGRVQRPPGGAGGG